MGQSKVKRKKFLSAHPTCCFCGGMAQATTIDHVPARSFFVDRKHPKGMEFPACAKCQNATTDAEDVTRQIAIMQGTALRAETLKYFLQKESSIFRGVTQRGTKFIDQGEHIAGNPIVRIEHETQESIIEVHRKLALAIYYSVFGKALNPEGQMSFTFFDVTKRKEVEEHLQLLNDLPSEPFVSDSSITEQFFYKYRQFDDADMGLLLYVGIYLHGFIAFVSYFQDESFVKGNFKKILRGPFVNS